MLRASIPDLNTAYSDKGQKGTRTFTMDEHLVSKWIVFVQTVRASADEFLSQSPDVHGGVVAAFGPEHQVPGYWMQPGVAHALRTYCGGEIPASREAILSLNHGALPNCLVLNGQCVNLSAILDAFSATGHVACGRVWLSLLDVADAAQPGNNGADTAQARKFIQSKMGLVSSECGMDVSVRQGTTNPLPPLDQLLGSVLGTFPGLQDTLQQLLVNAMGTTGDVGGGESVNAMLDHVQQSLLDPLLSKMQDTPGAPNIAPAMQQILGGFRVLTSQLTTDPKKS
jgi:hypothetical protein